MILELIKAGFSFSCSALLCHLKAQSFIVLNAIDGEKSCGGNQFPLLFALFRAIRD
jgi:hypothetical protein